MLGTVSLERFIVLRINTIRRSHSNPFNELKLFCFEITAQSNTLFKAKPVEKFNKIFNLIHVMFLQFFTPSHFCKII